MTEEHMTDAKSGWGVSERQFWLPTLVGRGWEKSPKSWEGRVAHEEMCQLHTDFFWSWYGSVYLTNKKT